VDFEEFRKKKMQQKKQAADQKKREDELAANGEKLDFIDGFGPQGPKNPKIKGFVLGRYQRKRVDPRTLQRPENYERTHAAPPEAPKTAAEIELERKKAALEKAQKDLEAAEEKRKLAEIEARRKKEGIGKVKGRVRY
tara:strand:+ start:393 stop:806 length:414 start_codon:yes stop_codon:yes gene_type:complete